MRTLNKIGETIGALLAIPFTILFVYVLYLVVAWSWDLLLWTAAVAFVGFVLFSIAQGLDEMREDAAKQGSPATTRLLQAIGAHAARSLAVASFAVATGLFAAAVFQGVVLSRSDDIYTRPVRDFEESLLYAKVWLDRALGLDVLAGVLAVMVALSLLFPFKSLVERTLSVRRTISFVHIVLLVLTSFTFFAGLMLERYDPNLRLQLRVMAASRFQTEYLDDRKRLVAVAWILNDLSDPAAPPIPPAFAGRLSGYLKDQNYYSEVDKAASQIAGIDTGRLYAEDQDRAKIRLENETDVQAERLDSEGAFDVVTFAPLRDAMRSLFGETFAWLKPDQGPSAWHYLQLMRKTEAYEQSGTLEYPLTQARNAAVEILATALAEKIGNAVTAEEIGHQFVSALVEAVTTPLWDVVLPLDVKDVDAARGFLAEQRLDRAHLDWSKLAELPEYERPQFPAETANTGTPTGSAASGTLGSAFHNSLPMPGLPSWQQFGSSAFVYRPPVGVPEVYTRPVFVPR